MARLLALDVIGGKGFYEVECNRLDDYYRELKCDTFDITTRKIGDKFFDIYCDDNGIFVENPIVSAVDEKLQPMLVGNLIFANHDIYGNTTSLRKEDIKTIIKNSASVAICNGDSDIDTYHIVLLSNC